VWLTCVCLRVKRCERVCVYVYRGVRGCVFTCSVCVCAFQVLYKDVSERAVECGMWCGVCLCNVCVCDVVWGMCLMCV
jgi:hypothetical protein